MDFQIAPDGLDRLAAALQRLGVNGLRISTLNDLLSWVCLKMVSTPTPNGFADHYPY